MSEYNRPWSRSEELALIAAVVDGRFAGLSLAESARSSAGRLDRTAEAIDSRTKVLRGEIRAAIAKHVAAGAVLPPPSRRVVRQVTWTPEMEDQLVSLFARGDGIAEIAAKMGPGLSMDAVRGRLQRLRGRGHPGVPQVKPRMGPRNPLNAWTDAELGLLRRAHAAGSTAATIAGMLNAAGGAVQRTASGVRTRIALLGLAGTKPVRKPVPDQPRAKVARAKRVRAEAQRAAPTPALASKPAPVAPVVPVVAVVPAVQARVIALPVPVPVPPPAPVLLGWGMTAMQRDAALCAHLDQLGGGWGAGADLALAAGLFSGEALDRVAQDLGCSPDAALTRFRALTAPFCGMVAKGLPIEAAAWLMPVLRARVDRSVQVAA